MGHIIAVYSGNGGAGCTTVAVNLAVGLRQREARVLLIDLSVPYADVGTFLNVNHETTLLDMLAEDVGIDELDSAIVRHDSGLEVLLGSPEPLGAEQLTALGITQLLEVAADNYDLIVVDLGHRLDDATFAALDSASLIVLLLTASITGVKNARLAMNIFRTRLYSPEKIVPVVNRTDANAVKQRLIPASSTIEKYLKMPVEASLPSDEAAALQALGRGRPIISTKSTTSPLAQALADLSSYIFKMLVYDGADETPEAIDRPFKRTNPEVFRPTVAMPPPAPLPKPEPSGSTITVLIVDSDPEAAEYVRKVLAFETDLETVGKAATGA